MAAQTGRAPAGEVVARTVRPSRFIWVTVACQAVLAAMWGWRVVEGERGLAVVSTMVFVLGFVVLGVLMLSDKRSALVLTDDELRVDRPWGLPPRRVARAAVRSVDGSVRGRPDWSSTVVLRVADGDRLRRFGLGGFDVHPRVLVPRLQEWAGVGADPAGTTAGG